MKEEIKAAKQLMKEKTRPYQTYGYYLAIPIVLIVTLIVPFLGIDLPNALGSILLIFTIFANIGVSKLSLLSKRKYVAPILMYIANGVSLFALILMFPLLLSLEGAYVAIGALYLIIFPLEISAIIFFFMTASDIKKAYPRMKQESEDARKKYLAIKKHKDE